MAYSLQAFAVAELPVPGWECRFGKNDCGFCTLIFYVWLLRGEGKTILVDAGPPPGLDDFEALRAACCAIDPRSTLKRLQTLEEVFQEARIEPSTIDFLLITQPITYHSGGIVESYFPNATIYISRAGMFEFLLEAPNHPPRHAYLTESTWVVLRRKLIQGQLILTDDSVEVHKSLWFETTGGHHPGSAAVRVTTSKGLVCILETAFVKENIDNEEPIGVAENAALCRKVIRRYKRQCDLVLAAHDETLIERFPGGVVA